MVVGIFCVVVSDGRFILGRGEWWWVFYGWWCVVVGIFWFVVEGSGFILVSGGRSCVCFD